MGFNSNFDPSLELGPAGVKVSGDTTALEDATLVSRTIALEQNGAVISGPATLALTRWGTVQPTLPAPSFETGPALALGTETYLVTSQRQPSFATFTWAQNVTLV